MADGKDEKLELFDWELYGMLVRNRRKKMGYKDADLFSQTLYRRVRLQISRDAIYKIETAKQEPTTTQFMGINLALWGEVIPSEITSFCMIDQWKTMVDEPKHPYIPDEWVEENRLAATQKGACEGLTIPEGGLNCEDAMVIDKEIDSHLYKRYSTTAEDESMPF